VWQDCGTHIQVPFKGKWEHCIVGLIDQPRGFYEGRYAMRNTLMAVAAAGALALTAVAAPQPAEARGGAVALGVLGGLAAGAVIGSAAANAGPGYYYGPTYYAPGPTCYWQRQRVWDGFAWRIQRVQVCQ
jgi:hypothetical protein